MNPSIRLREQKKGSMGALIEVMTISASASLLA